MATFRGPMQFAGRHPPPLAKTVSNFKPRGHWSNAGSSIFLLVNLPGFYRDQIDIKIDEKTRTIQIQGQRPLSARTKARFSEAYRVPESCDITKSNTSFSLGLLTIEFPAIVEGSKPEKPVQEQGKAVQRSNQEESNPNRNSLGRKKPSDEEKQMGTNQEKAAPATKKEEPRTYKSVVEGKRAVMPAGSREKAEQKAKEGEARPSLGRKEQTKEEKVVEKKEVAQMNQQKIGQKLKEEEARSTPTLGDNLKAKLLEKQEKVTSSKKNSGIGQKMKEEGLFTRTPSIGGTLGQKLKEMETPATNQATSKLKPKEKDESTAQDVKVNDGKIVEDKVEGGKETVDAKENPEVTKPRGEDREKKGSLVLKARQKMIDANPPSKKAGGREEEESQRYDLPLVNVGAAALVILGFGAYVCVPLVKLFF